MLWSPPPTPLAYGQIDCPLFRWVCSKVGVVKVECMTDGETLRQSPLPSGSKKTDDNLLRDNNSLASVLTDDSGIIDGIIKGVHAPVSAVAKTSTPSTEEGKPMSDGLFKDAEQASASAAQYARDT